jgi:hypothetical protein
MGYNGCQELQKCKKGESLSPSQISKSAKREKVCHLCIGIYKWNYYGLIIEKVSTGMVDEKVTVISSFLTLLILLLLKLGMH